MSGTSVNGTWSRPIRAATDSRLVWTAKPEPAQASAPRTTPPRPPWPGSTEVRWRSPVCPTPASQMPTRPTAACTCSTSNRARRQQSTTKLFALTCRSPIRSSRYPTPQRSRRTLSRGCWSRGRWGAGALVSFLDDHLQRKHTHTSAKTKSPDPDRLTLAKCQRDAGPPFDDKPDPDTTKKIRALRDDCLAFKRFGLPARPSPPRLGLGRCSALARLCAEALG
jgi:hypothetical protein